MSVAPNWWLARMTSTPGGHEKELWNVAIFGILLGLSVFAISLSGYFMYNSTLRASEKLHGRMTTSIIQAPVLFFDTNPSGRIMNRFSKDIGSMDDVLPYYILHAVHLSFFIVIAFLLPAGTNVWLVLAACPVVVTVLYIGRYYLKSSRELKRLEAVRCSPVYSHISETILGLEVIRASRMGHHFLEKFYRLVILTLLAHLHLPNSPLLLT